MREDALWSAGVRARIALYEVTTNFFGCDGGGVGGKRGSGFGRSANAVNDSGGRTAEDSVVGARRARSAGDGGDRQTIAELLRAVGWKSVGDSSDRRHGRQL